MLNCRVEKLSPLIWMSYKMKFQLYSKNYIYYIVALQNLFSLLIIIIIDYDNELHYTSLLLAGGCPWEERETLPKTLTPFMTKISNIPFPIYDLTKNL